MANKQTLFCGTNAEFLSAELVKEANESNSGVAFRIPSLVNAGGTLVAAIDKAHVPMDWGFIELAVRTSTDGGKTWTNIKTIATKISGNWKYASSLMKFLFMMIL